MGNLKRGAVGGASREVIQLTHKKFFSSSQKSNSNHHHITQYQSYNSVVVSTSRPLQRRGSSTTLMEEELGLPGGEGVMLVLFGRLDGSDAGGGGWGAWRHRAREGQLQEQHGRPAHHPWPRAEGSEMMGRWPVGEGSNAAPLTERHGDIRSQRWT